MRTFAIGDIHGCLTSLEALAAYADFQSDDIVVTLGDYVDRGPNSKGVIDWLLALRERCQLIHLRGNHE
ncbi:MAG: metallophosphoesterase, partial [Verrucomicrobiales bacterium]